MWLLRACWASQLGRLKKWAGVLLMQTLVCSRLWKSSATGQAPPRLTQNSTAQLCKGAFVPVWGLQAPLKGLASGPGLSAHWAQGFWRDGVHTGFPEFPCNCASVTHRGVCFPHTFTWLAPSSCCFRVDLKENTTLELSDGTHDV